MTVDRFFTSYQRPAVATTHVISLLTINVNVNVNHEDYIKLIQKADIVQFI